jgi:membrane fusion protein, macrolide-specific efflux system
MQGKYRNAVVGLVLIVAAVGGWWAWRGGADAAAPLYREATVTRGDIEVAALATGVVKPRNRLEIKPPVAGRIEEVRVREGESVKRGTLLALMSSSERAALLDAASVKGPAELKRWEELYRATPIYAPMAGTVIARNVEPGQTLTVQDAVLVMSDRLVVKAQVDETDIARVRTRQQARITLDAYPEQILPGVVGQVAFDATTVNNVITYEVDVLPERAPAFMRSGMTANVSFVVARKENTLIVPTEAIRQRDGRSQVLLPPVEGKGEPRARDVQLGVSDGRRTEVLDGLALGDTVLVPQLGAGKSVTGTNPFGPNMRRR